MHKREKKLRLLARAIVVACSLASSPLIFAAETPRTSAKSSDTERRPAQARKQPTSEIRNSETTLKLEERAQGNQDGPQVRAASSEANELELLREQLALQQKQIEQLRIVLEDQKHLLEKALQSTQKSSVETPSLGQVASIQPVIPVGFAVSDAGPKPPPAVSTPPATTQEEIQRYTAKVDDLNKKMTGALKNLGGFKFSGDLRLRADVQARSGNAVAPPLQSIRSLYRLRLNVDNRLDPRFDFHMQLSSAPFNNGISNDQDFGAMVAKHPFSIAEAYVDFHPDSRFSLRAGRMEELFADHSRFLWDDDVRFNGFHQVFALPVASSFLHFDSVELRAAEYIFSTPNVAILPPSSAFVSAGYQPGQKVRDANLFHPGFVAKGDLSSSWNHEFAGDVQIYRNSNQIQLASTANGVPVVVSNGLGVTLSGPMPGTGNATTTPGGAVYSARNFQIVRVAYRLEHRGWKFRDRAMPAWLDFQAARNTGTSRLRDAFMASANLGEVKSLGDVRFLYQFGIKDANSMISQFTDNDFGTGTGVNIATHAVRFDLGLTRFLQWQNLLFFQNERRPSNPVGQFFVPLQRGANTTFRYLGQLTFTF